MNTSSIFRFGIILILFIVIQGWLLMRMFVVPRVFQTHEAAITGVKIDIRSPVAGLLQTVAVREGQHVEEGQLLFIVRRTLVDPGTQRWHEENLPIFSMRSGIVNGIQTMRGTYVSASQHLASVTDNSADVLAVTARLPMPPRDVHRIRPLMSATVQADYLRDGDPIEAMVSTVEPEYDAQRQILTVRLQLLRYPDEIDGLPSGMPVNVEIREERKSDENPIIAIVYWLFPFSEARQNQ